MHWRVVAAYLRGLSADTDAASLVEYAVTAAIICAALLVTLTALAPAIARLFSNAANAF